MEVNLSDIGTDGKEVKKSEKCKYLQTAFDALMDKYIPVHRAQIDLMRRSVGKILPDRVREKFQRRGMPDFEISLPQQTILFMAGTIAKNIRKFKAAPRKAGAEKEAELRSRQCEWAFEISRGYEKLARAAVHATIARHGWVNMYWDFSKSHDGDPCLEVVDPNLIMKDPDPGQDRFRTYFPMMSLNEILDTYSQQLDKDGQPVLTPEKIAIMKDNAEKIEGRRADENDQTPKSAFERLGGEWFRKRWNEYWDITTGKKGGGNIWFDDASGLYRVVEWHDKRQETHKFIYSPVADPETGEQPFEEIPKEFHDDKEYVDQVKNTTVPVQTPEGIQTGERPKYPAAMEHEERVTKIWLTVICPTLLPDDLIMEIEHPVQDAGFQYKDIACYDWHPDPLETISVMDTIKAPTDLFIHQLIASMTLINKAVAPPYLFPKGMIVGEQMQAFKSQAGGEMKEYTQIAGYSKPEQEETPVKLVQFLSGLGDEARSLVEYLGGISPSGKGYKDSGKEGAALFQAKIRQNEVMTYYLFKNISEATRECWVYMSQLLRVYLKTPRELQILADTDNPETLVVNAGIINGQNTNVEDEKYDFIPDIQSIGESARQEKVVSLGQILPMAMNFDPMAGGWVLAKILKYMDIPEGSEGAKLIEQLIGQRQQMQQQQMAMAEGHQKLDLLSKAKELVSKPKQKQIPQRSAA